MKFRSRKSRKETASLDPKVDENDKLLGYNNDESFDPDVITSVVASGNGSQLQILIEVCAAEDLRDMQMGRPDPYVTILLGNENIHETKHKINTSDPIWTAKSGSLCLLSVDSEEFLQAENGITFTVMDKDVGSDDVLGSVSVPKDTILGSKGERRECKLLKEGAGNDSVGTLVLRFRNATPHDIRFMKALANDDVTALDMLPDFMVQNKCIKTGYLKPNIPHHRESIMQKIKHRNKPPNMHYVRPVPNPEDPKEEYMTNEDIEALSMEPSNNWIEVGRRKSLGKIFIEIIKCDNLPSNIDPTPRDKADGFVSIAYEDNFVNTDVIYDCKSPKWLPWTNRAFMLNVYNPLSPIKIGVLDHDTIGSDDGIGRISISPGNFRPGTGYLLNYDLRSASGEICTHKGSNSTITIRLHTEISASQMLWATLKSAPALAHKTYVSVNDKQDGGALTFTIADRSVVGIQNFKACLAELLSYSDVMLYIKEAIATVLFWRGTFFITDDLAVPIHSVIAFFCGTYLVEHPKYLPSFLFGFVAWILLGAMNFKQNNPNPWAKNLSYRQMFGAAIGGYFCNGPQSIDTLDEDDLLKIKAHTEYWRNAQKAAEIKAKKAKDLEGVEDEAETIESVELESHNDFLILSPLQGVLNTICTMLNMTSNIITWEENYVTFWLTTIFIFLSVFSCFVPWGVVILYSTRIIVWTFLGPWMGLVGVCFVKNSDTPETAAEKAEDKKQWFDLWSKTTLRNAQIIREKKTSFRAMELLMFGKYTNATPSVQTEGFKDVPLGSSSATPSDLDVNGLRTKCRFVGQAFKVDMIPSMEHTVDKADYAAEENRFAQNVAVDMKPSIQLDRNASVYYDSIN